MLSFTAFDNEPPSSSGRYSDTFGPGGPFGGGTLIVAPDDGVELALVSPPFRAVGQT